MKDLYRCLDEYRTPMLHAIAQMWGMTLSTDNEPEMVAELAGAMTSHGRLRALVDGLDNESRDILSDLVREGGQMPGHRLTLLHGQIRRFGPARLERERPWEAPENALEALYFRGLVYRAYGQIGSHTGEIFLIPEQFLAPLREMGIGRSVLALDEVAPPAFAREAADALVEDLFTILVHVRLTRISWNKPGPAVPTPDLLTAIDLGERLVGSAHPERLTLMWYLLWKLGLLQVEGDALAPSLRARDWLQASDTRRMRTVFAAWLDMAEWDELERLATIRCERTNELRSPVLARRNLLMVLAECPRDRWFSLKSLIEALKRVRPDFLRVDGDYDSWVVRASRTHELLAGFEAWDRIEGELARYMLVRPLFWLGIVELGVNHDVNDASVDADDALENTGITSWRLTAQGEALLAAMTGTQTRDARGASSARATSPTATVSSQFLVTISRRESMYARYQLERFAERQSLGDEVVYLITDDSIWRSQNAGIKVDQILGFLNRISGGQAAPRVMRTIRAWGGRFGRATLERMAILETVDVQTMRQIKANPQLAPLLGKALSATTCLVADRHWDALVNGLKTLGIWPTIAD